MKIHVAQLVVGRDLESNLKRMLAVIDAAGPGDWVVFPEGVLSGYFPEDEGFLAGLDPARVEAGVEAVAAAVAAQSCNCIFGTATFAGGAWHNSVIMVTAGGLRHTYDKIELSSLDRLRFEPGTRCDAVRAGHFTFGVLACREALFPAMWARLKQQGAQVVFHINNAIQPHDLIWRHIFVTRAIEQGIFVCSVNNGSAPQELPSFLVTPAGRVLIETKTGRDDIAAAEIDLSQAIEDLTRRTDF